MAAIVVILLTFLIGFLRGIEIPAIRNASLIPRNEYNNFMTVNGTCQECLCMGMDSAVAVNCFLNETCQLFNTFPSNYKVQYEEEGRIYFPQQTFPNRSQCCMPNTTLLLDKLRGATAMQVDTIAPRSIIIDNQGYLVTISKLNKIIVRYFSQNLSRVMYPVSPTFLESPYAIAYYNQSYYVSFDRSIYIVDSENMTIMYTFSNGNRYGFRSIIFLDYGQIMVASSVYNTAILFFNLTNGTSKQYNLSYIQSVPFYYPQGLWYVNDTYFYATSWSANEVYSLSMVNRTFWKADKIIATSPPNGSGEGNNLLVDECDRLWFSLGIYGIGIYDGRDVIIFNLTQIGGYVFDVQITNNYVIYISQLIYNRTVQFNLNIDC